MKIDVTYPSERSVDFRRTTLQSDLKVRTFHNAIIAKSVGWGNMGTQDIRVDVIEIYRM